MGPVPPRLKEGSAFRAHRALPLRALPIVAPWRDWSDFVRNGPHRSTAATESASSLTRFGALAKGIHLKRVRWPGAT
jgi:hypothetical protein